MAGCKKKCGSYVPDPCDEEKIGTSQIKYDGPTLPGLCVQPGMPLNKVLKIIDDAIIRLSQASAEMKAETFTEFTHEDEMYVMLGSTPYNILSVSYCGGVVPVNGYMVNGRKLKLNENYCFMDGNELRVVYMKKFTGTCENEN
jgi:hypothetical protein